MSIGPALTGPALIVLVSIVPVPPGAGLVDSEPIDAELADSGLASGTLLMSLLSTCAHAAPTKSSTPKLPHMEE
jgi:hypothetical protein